MYMWYIMYVWFFVRVMLKFFVINISIMSYWMQSSYRGSTADAWGTRWIFSRLGIFVLNKWFVETVENPQQTNKKYIASWEVTYPLKKGTLLKMMFLFPRVGYVPFLEGNHVLVVHKVETVEIRQIFQDAWHSPFIEAKVYRNHPWNYPQLLQ